MKGMIQSFAVLCLFTSVSSAGWDFEITEGYHGSFTLTGSERFLMTGGGTATITAENSSYVEIWGSDPLNQFPGGISGIHLKDSSDLNYYGGETALLDVREHGAAILQGGVITTIRTYQHVPSDNQPYSRHIEIVCRSYDASNPNFITGVWDVDNDEDGEYDTFAINLVDQAGYDRVIDNIFCTPEPGTLCMMGLGGLLLRRRRGCK